MLPTNLSFIESIEQCEVFDGNRVEFDAQGT